MKTKFKVFLTAIALIVAFSAISCSNSNKKTNEATTDAPQELAEYTCPMHQDVINEGPGNCPECGMALVEKKSHVDGDMENINEEGHDHDHESGAEHNH